MSAVRNVLLQFKPQNGNPACGKNPGLVLQSKDQNTSRQSRWTVLRLFGNSVWTVDTGSGVSLSENINYVTN